MIAAIETRYKGCRFRSRLEARWAVFFDALDIKWQYEPQGFEIKTAWEEDKTKWLYLPDFYLPDFGTWVEVKGDSKSLSDDYLQMIAWAIDWGGCLPNVEESDKTTRGLLWLGSIPFVNERCRPSHLIFQHSRGGWMRTVCFDPVRKLFPSVQIGDLNTSDYFDATSGNTDDIRMMIDDFSRCTRVFNDAPSWELRQAYIDASSARFEHGEQG